MRKVTYVKLHGDIFVPAFGVLGSVLPPANKTIQLDMSYGTQDGAEGLYLLVKNSIEVFVPASTVLLTVFAPKETPKAK